MQSNTQTIISTFLLALSFGTQLFSPVVDSRLTGVGFYKLGVSIVLGALAMNLGLVHFLGPALEWSHYACYGVLLTGNVLGHALHRDRKTWPMWLLYGVQIAAFLILIFTALPLEWVEHFMFTAFFLGISNFAMILGHYYLVVPKLSEEPLIYCLFIFWTVLLLRLSSSVLVLLQSGELYLQEGTQHGDGYLYNWLFISMRYLWGYLAPFILSLFTFRLCRLRSIQSATGVLYIIEFFVIVGELISIYLMARHGLAV